MGGAKICYVEFYLSVFACLSAPLNVTKTLVFCDESMYVNNIYIYDESKIELFSANFDVCGLLFVLVCLPLNVLYNIIIIVILLSFAKEEW